MKTLADEELLRFLAEDCPFSDLTTEGLALADVPARADLTARDDMVLCGVEEAARMFELSGASVALGTRSGNVLKAGAPILTASGDAGSLHRTYKVAQTLMEILSGISTATRAIVDAARSSNPACHVVCTRKHMPGMKRLALRAIETGGAKPHRLGLSDYVLVFEEHRVLLDKAQPLAVHFKRLRSETLERRLAAEAATVEEALMLAAAGVDIVQVDKLPPEQVSLVSKGMERLTPRPLLAAAGGIHAGNAAAYAAAGADILVTSSPYYAPPKDVKVQFRTA